VKTAENARDGHTLDGQLTNVSMTSSIRGDITYHKLTSSMRQGKDLAFGASPNKELNKEPGNIIHCVNATIIMK